VRPLILTEQQQVEIARVKAFAEGHRYSQAMMTAVASGEAKPPGDIPGHVCALPIGFRVVYSVENHPGGLYRHLSVSVDGTKWPNEHAVQEIARAFFDHHDFNIYKPPTGAMTWMEDAVRAVNLIVPYRKSYVIMEGGKAIKCFSCGAVSPNAADVANKYCGKCCKFHDVALAEEN
jgi:hypothetical protein